MHRHTIDLTQKQHDKLIKIKNKMEAVSIVEAVRRLIKEKEL